MTVWKADRQLDIRGRICPYPTLDTISTLQEMEAGEVLEVITDYYPARQTIPALMRERGYPCKLIDEGEPIFRFVIRKQ
jgi:TusA-related sulfurtransferase